MSTCNPILRWRHDRPASPKNTTWSLRTPEETTPVAKHSQPHTAKAVFVRVWTLVASGALQWEAADAEIKVPYGENTELKRSPFKAWSRSVYSHTCYPYCQEFLPCLFLPFQSIHLHFFKTSPEFFLVLAVANTGCCVGPQNKLGRPVGCRILC